jgi:hypothetical protein
MLLLLITTLINRTHLNVDKAGGRKENQVNRPMMEAEVEASC